MTEEIEVHLEDFPSAWSEIIRDKTSYLERIPGEDLKKWAADIKQFISEKRFEGCAGLEVTEEMKVIIAAQACMLILHKKNFLFPSVNTILIYPSDFRVPESPEGSDYPRERAGESWHQDYVILSWDNVLNGAIRSEDGVNLVIHEFAHQFDLANGRTDGMPPLSDPAVYSAWKRVSEREFNKLRKAAYRNQRTLIDKYGATNPAEFFAVVSELFIERPEDLRRKHCNLYELFKAIYEIDPSRPKSAATWKANPGEWTREMKWQGDKSEAILRDGEKALRNLLQWTVIVLLLLLLVFLFYR